MKQIRNEETTMSGLKDKVAIVTGATWLNDGGVNIGGATAEELVAQGAKVVVADINGQGAADLAARINEGNEGAALASTTDVRNESDLKALVAQTLAEFGCIDVVINNAGVFRGDDGLIGDLDIDVWDDVIAVNVRGAMLLTKLVLPEMLKNGSGSIVNTASTHSFAGDIRLSAYGASKSAVNALTMYTATQYGHAGIRCNAICPGTTLSPPAQKLPEASRRVYERHTMNPGLSRPSDLARVFAFLASDASSGINGSIIRSDGGLLAHQPFSPDFRDMAQQ
jgi:NAD(P)-dependent dehydrogenase (short-subunit alcohol dehydrogenase family)